MINIFFFKLLLNYYLFPVITIISNFTQNKFLRKFIKKIKINKNNILKS